VHFLGVQVLFLLFVWHSHWLRSCWYAMQRYANRLAWLCVGAPITPHAMCACLGTLLWLPPPQSKLAELLAAPVFCVCLSPMLLRTQQRTCTWFEKAGVYRRLLCSLSGFQPQVIRVVCNDLKGIKWMCSWQLPRSVQMQELCKTRPGRFCQLQIT
jgi:hypothetical protein